MSSSNTWTNGQIKHSRLHLNTPGVVLLFLLAGDAAVKASKLPTALSCTAI